MQNFGGQTRCIMGDAQMTNAIFEKKRLHLRTVVNLRNRSRVIIISPQLKKLSAKLYIPLYCIVFLLHPIDNTLVVQYQLVQGCLNYVYIKKEIRMEKGT